MSCCGQSLAVAVPWVPSSGWNPKFSMKGLFLCHLPEVKHQHEQFSVSLLTEEKGKRPSLVGHTAPCPKRPSCLLLRAMDSDSLWRLHCSTSITGASLASSSSSSRFLSSALRWISSSTTSSTHPPRQSTPRARRERTPTVRQRQGHFLASKTRGHLFPADLESPSLQLLLGTVSGSWDGTGLSNWVWPPRTLLPRTLVKPTGNCCKACEDHTQNTDGGGLYEKLKRSVKDTMGFQGSRNSSVQFKSSPRSLSCCIVLSWYSLAPSLSD